MAILAAMLVAAAPEFSGTTIQRRSAPEAEQGVAVSADRFYAIGTREIGAYDRGSGKRVAHWSGDPAQFTHLNSCVVDRRELVCAHSNYPGVPMTSTVETFDARTLRHLHSRSIGAGIGSLTWFVRHDGSWWAGFANYDGKGGTPGRDHRMTTLVRYDRAFVEQRRWLFPDAVLERFSPKSNSGGTWGDDGLLYASGHDRPELYALRVPETSGVLELVATIAVEANGQAIAWDPVGKRQLWAINRPTLEVLTIRLPPVTPPAAPDPVR